MFTNMQKVNSVTISKGISDLARKLLSCLTSSVIIRCKNWCPIDLHLIFPWVSVV